METSSEKIYHKRRRILWGTAIALYVVIAIVIISTEAIRLSKFDLSEMREKAKQNEEKKAAQNKEKKKKGELPKKELEKMSKFMAEKKIERIKKEIQKVDKAIEQIEKKTEQAKEEYKQITTPEEETIRRIAALANQINNTPDITGDATRHLTNLANMLKTAQPDQRNPLLDQMANTLPRVQQAISKIQDTHTRERKAWQGREMTRLIEAAQKGDWDAARQVGEEPPVIPNAPLPETDSLSQWKNALEQREQALDATHDQFKAYEGGVVENQAVDANMSASLLDAYAKANPPPPSDMTGGQMPQGDMAGQMQQGQMPQGDMAGQMQQGQMPQGDMAGQQQQGQQGGDQQQQGGSPQNRDEFDKQNEAWKGMADKAMRLAARAGSMSRAMEGKGIHKADQFSAAKSINSAVTSGSHSNGRNGGQQGLDLTAAMGNIYAGQDNSAGGWGSIRTDRNIGMIADPDPTKRARVTTQFDSRRIVAESIPGRRIDPRAKRKGWLFIDSWYVIGPWEAGFRDPSSKLPRKEPETRIDLDAEYAGKIDPNTKQPLKLKWKYIQSDIVSIQPPKVLGNSYWYAYSEVWFKEPSDVIMAIGSDDAIKVWFNDIVVWEDEGLSPWNLVEGIVKVRFKQGWNKILLRLHNGPSIAEFSLTFCPLNDSVSEK